MPDSPSNACKSTRDPAAGSPGASPVPTEASAEVLAQSTSGSAGPNVSDERSARADADCDPLQVRSITRV